MASDQDPVACNEAHEMEFILTKYSKRTNNQNILKLSEHCKSYRTNDSYIPHNRENFYLYIEKKDVLKELE